MLSLLVVGLVTRAVGSPMRGVAGKLARRNAARNSRRTATTAALMIGLTLVTTALVVGDSVKPHSRPPFERSAKADYYVTDELEEVGTERTLAGEPARRRRVGGHGVHARRRPSRRWVTGVAGFDFNQVDNLLDVDVTQAASTPASSTRLSCRPTRRSRPAPTWRHRRRAVGCRRERDGDDRRTVRRPGDPRRGLSVRHERARGGRHRADREWLAFSFADDASQATKNAVLAGLADEYPCAADRDRRPVPGSWPAWSTRSWRWSTRWSRWLS